MYEGQQLYARDGHQVALFPLASLSVTQGYGPETYSHCCGAPMDFARTIEHTPLYAPFDMHRTYYYTGGGNGRMYASDREVWTPLGLMYVSILVVHDNNPPTATQFQQGQIFAHTGTAGNVQGEHVHIETAEGVQDSQITSSITCRGGTARCDYIANYRAPNLLLFVNDTTIINNGGYDWQTYSGGIPHYSERGLSLIKKWYACNNIRGRM